MAQIFISYSRADRQFVDAFIPLIRKVYGNDSLWFDEDIHGGANWWQMILNEIAICDLFIYLISDEALESPYCQSELREAVRLNKQILPVIVRRLKPPYPGNIEADLAQVLHDTQYVDLSSGFKDANLIAALYASINRLLRQVPVEPPTPVTSRPVPEPKVIDKVKPHRPAQVRQDVLAAIAIGLFGVVIVVMVGGMISVLGTLREDNLTETPSLDVTTAIAFVDIESETEQPTITPTDTATSTETAQPTITATYTDFPSATPTATSTVTSSPTSTVTDLPTNTVPPIPTTQAITITSTPSATDELITATNVSSESTLSPEEIAFTPVTQNLDWTPYEKLFEGIPMMLVPSGCFFIGNLSTGYSNQQPEHELCFDTPFWIDKTEVIQADFHKYSEMVVIDIYEGNNLPLHNVTWNEAYNYCSLLGARLPTEAEWEYSASGPTNLTYPWGNQYYYDNPRANNGEIYRPNRLASIPTRLNGESWVGAEDMSGNVWEWTSSKYQPYPYNKTDGREDIVLLEAEVLRVLRGGSYINGSTQMAASFRSFAETDTRKPTIGFRCARDFK